MFRITVQDAFCAAHTLQIAGAHEPVHGHNFRVTAAIEGPSLDTDGLLCDFHTVEASLRSILDPFRNNNLNATPPFDTTNPTAELIAKHIAGELTAALASALEPYGSRVAWVSVTEAEGCVATYTPPAGTP